MVTIATVQSDAEQCRRLRTQQWGACNIAVPFSTLFLQHIQPQYKIKTKWEKVLWKCGRVDVNLHAVYLHPLCPLLVESVLSGPGGRWRWTVLWWSIPGRSLGRSSCTSPSSLWTAPTRWEKRKRKDRPWALSYVLWHYINSWTFIVKVQHNRKSQCCDWFWDSVHIVTDIMQWKCCISVKSFHRTVTPLCIVGDLSAPLVFPL